MADLATSPAPRLLPAKSPRGHRARLLLIVAASAALSACGGGSGDTARPPAPPNPPTISAPVITTFTATPARLTAGQETLLTFAATNATTLSVSPSPGLVSGPSVVVTPSATTTYVLTASNGSGSATASVEVTVEPFVANDVMIGASNASYIQVEISPDMRFMTWIEQGAGPNGSSIAWLCALDPVSGTLRPSSGRGVRLADIRDTGSPQWGQDATGFYSTTIDVEGRIVIARPALAASGEVTAQMSRLDTPPNQTRTFPYPNRVNQPGGFVLYQQADPQDASRQQLWYLDLRSPDQEVQITRGDVAKIGQFDLPPFLVNVQRWFSSLETNANGIPVATFGDAVPNPGGNQPLTLEQIDFSTSPATRTRVLGTSPQILDPNPFLYQGERFVIGGLNGGPVGVVQRRDAAGSFTVEAARIETSSTGLSNPGQFASAEPFIRNGRVFTAYQLNEPGFPGTVNGEIWLASVFDRTLTRRISQPIAMARADPEIFVGREKVWVIYYARQPGAAKWELRRADTGL